MSARNIVDDLPISEIDNQLLDKLASLGRVRRDYEARSNPSAQIGEILDEQEAIAICATIYREHGESAG